MNYKNNNQPYSCIATPSTSPKRHQSASPKKQSAITTTTNNNNNNNNISNTPLSPQKLMSARQASLTLTVLPSTPPTESLCGNNCIPHQHYHRNPSSSPTSSQIQPKVSVPLPPKSLTQPNSVSPEKPIPLISCKPQSPPSLPSSSSSSVSTTMPHTIILHSSPPTSTNSHSTLPSTTSSHATLPTTIKPYATLILHSGLSITTATIPCTHGGTTPTILPQHMPQCTHLHPHTQSTPTLSPRKPLPHTSSSAPFFNSKAIKEQIRNITPPLKASSSSIGGIVITEAALTSHDIPHTISRPSDPPASPNSSSDSLPSSSSSDSLPSSSSSDSLPSSATPSSASSMDVASPTLLSLLTTSSRPPKSKDKSSSLVPRSQPPCPPRPPPPPPQSSGDKSPLDLSKKAVSHPVNSHKYPLPPLHTPTSYTRIRPAPPPNPETLRKLIRALPYPGVLPRVTRPSPPRHRSPLPPPPRLRFQHTPPPSQHHPPSPSVHSPALLRMSVSTLKEHIMKQKQLQQQKQQKQLSPPPPIPPTSFPPPPPPPLPPSAPLFLHQVTSPITPPPSPLTHHQVLRGGDDGGGDETLQKDGNEMEVINEEVRGRDDRVVLKEKEKEVGGDDEMMEVKSNEKVMIKKGKEANRSDDFVALGERSARETKNTAKYDDVESTENGDKVDLREKKREEKRKGDGDDSWGTDLACDEAEAEMEVTEKEKRKENEGEIKKKESKISEVENQVEDKNEQEIGKPKQTADSSVNSTINNKHSLRQIRINRQESEAKEREERKAEPGNEKQQSTNIPSAKTSGSLRTIRRETGKETPEKKDTKKGGGVCSGTSLRSLKMQFFKSVEEERIKKKERQKREMAQRNKEMREKERKLIELIRRKEELMKLQQNKTEDVREGEKESDENISRASFVLDHAKIKLRREMEEKKRRMEAQRKEKEEEEKMKKNPEEESKKKEEEEEKIRKEKAEEESRKKEEEEDKKKKERKEQERTKRKEMEEKEKREEAARRKKEEEEKRRNNDKEKKEKEKPDENIRNKETQVEKEDKKERRKKTQLPQEEEVNINPPTTTVTTSPIQHPTSIMTTPTRPSPSPQRKNPIEVPTDLQDEEIEGFIDNLLKELGLTFPNRRLKENKEKERKLTESETENQLNERNRILRSEECRESEERMLTERGCGETEKGRKLGEMNKVNERNKTSSETDNRMSDVRESDRERDFIDSDKGETREEPHEENEEGEQNQEEEVMDVNCAGVEGCECSNCHVPFVIADCYTLTQASFGNLMEEKEEGEEEELVSEESNALTDDSIGDGVISKGERRGRVENIEEREEGGRFSRCRKGRFVRRKTAEETEKEQQRRPTGRRGRRWSRRETIVRQKDISDSSESCSSTTNSLPHCFVCDCSTIEEAGEYEGKSKEKRPQDNLRSHLYFGSVSCEFCNQSIVNCHELKSLYSHALELRTCRSSPTHRHLFSYWSTDPYHYLTSNLTRDLLIWQFCEKERTPLSKRKVGVAVIKYLRSLNKLSSDMPWKTAIDLCWHSIIETGLLEEEEVKEVLVVETEEAEEVENEELEEMEITDKEENKGKEEQTNQLGEGVKNVTVKENERKKEEKIEEKNKKRKKVDGYGRKKLRVSEEEEDDDKQERSNSLSRNEKRGMEEEESQQDKAKRKHTISLNADEDNENRKATTTSKRKTDSPNTTDQDHSINDNRDHQPNLTISTQNEPSMSQPNQSKPNQPDLTQPYLKKVSPTQPRQNKPSPSKNHITINTPPDGHFLLIRYPAQPCPEECPECYTPMCPTRCTYSFRNGLVTYQCPDCGLIVYFVTENCEVVFLSS